MSSAEKAKAATVPELQEFFHTIIKILERWMKAMTE